MRGKILKADRAAKIYGGETRQKSYGTVNKYSKNRNPYIYLYGLNDKNSNRRKKSVSVISEVYKKQRKKNMHITHSPHFPNSIANFQTTKTFPLPEKKLQKQDRNSP
jgi:hypothetical protein